MCFPALTQTLLFFFTLQKITSSSEDVAQNNTINIYPNPTSDIIYVSSTNFDGASIFISDIAGRKLIAQTTISTNTSIDISGLQPGIYHLSLNYKNGNIQTQKLIVQR